MYNYHTDEFSFPEEMYPHLQYLPLIETLGSIRGAADEIGCDRGTIKHHIRLIREEAKDCLFWWDSKARKTRWTEIGKIYLQKGKDQQIDVQHLKDYECSRALRAKHNYDCKIKLIPAAIILLREINYEITHNLFPGETPLIFMCRKCCLKFAVPNTPDTQEWLSAHPEAVAGTDHIFLTIPTPSEADL